MLMKKTVKLTLIIGAVISAILACTTVSDGLSQPNLLFEDDFSNTSSGWDRFEDELTLTDYHQGQYRISIKTDSYFAWATPYENFDDVIIEVDAVKLSGGEENDIGIICKHQDTENFYALSIGTDGFATIFRRYLGGDLEPLLDWVESSAINQGDALNHLRAECVGNRLSLYVNGELVVEAFDDSITKGDVGLIASTYESPNLDVAFDNFIARKPLTE